MSLDTWLLYAAASLLLSLTPGPSGLLALAHGATMGVRRASVTVAGGVAGFAVLIAASASGLGALLASSAVAFDAVRWAGATYLVWLGVRTWRAPPTRVDAAAGVSAPGARRGAGLFAEGFLVALSNPKVVLFFAAFLPQFVDPAAPLAPQFVVMGVTFLAVEFAVELLLAAGAARLLPWLSREAVARRFARVTGGLFVGAGVALVALDR